MTGKTALFLIFMPAFLFLSAAEIPLYAAEAGETAPPEAVPAQPAGNAPQAAQNPDGGDGRAEPEKKEVTNVLSFDLGYFLQGIRNKGFSFGMNYEQLIVDHFSLRGMAGIMYFRIPQPQTDCIGVTASVYANCYPFSARLDKFYAGLGFTADFLNYFRGETLPNPPMDALLSVSPILGWKQNVLNLVMLDFYASYGFLMLNTQRIRDAENYIRSGLRFGIKFKILWRPGKNG